MSLEDIRNKILQDAENRGNELLINAKSKREEILNGYRQKAEEFRDTVMKKALISGENLKRGIIIDAKMRKKREILKKKRMEIEESIHQALIEFIKQPGYKEWIENRIEEQWDEKEGIVVVGAEEKILNNKWLEGLNKRINGNLKFSAERADIIGGIWIKGRNGSVNLSLERIIRGMKKTWKKKFPMCCFELIYRG